MIGRAMEKWDDDALRRVFDAPLERWHEPGYFDHRDGADRTKVCLVMHAAGLTGRSKRWIDDVEDYFLEMDQYEEEIGRRFDKACTRFGLPRIVRAIKTRALDILLRRHPLDSKLVVLRAEVGA